MERKTVEDDIRGSVFDLAGFVYMLKRNQIFHQLLQLKKSYYHAPNMQPQHVFFFLSGDKQIFLLHGDSLLMDHQFNSALMSSSLVLVGSWGDKLSFTVIKA